MLRHWLRAVLVLVAACGIVPHAHAQSEDDLLPAEQALDDLVDMTHLRWILLRPAADWPSEAARARYAESQMCKHIVSLGKSTLKEQKASAEDINLIGSPEEVIEKAMAFRKAGVTHFLGLYFAANSADELVDQMQMFAEEVMPKIK